MPKQIDQYEHTDKTRPSNPPVGLVTPKTDPDAIAPGVEGTARVAASTSLAVERTVTNACLRVSLSGQTTGSFHTPPILGPGPLPLDDHMREDISHDMERLFFCPAERLIEAQDDFAACIILVAAVHQMAAIREGDVLRVNGDEFKRCVRHHVKHNGKPYNDEALWHSLRCGLFHRGVPQPYGINGGAVVPPVKLSSIDADDHDPCHPVRPTVHVGTFLSEARSALASVLTETQSDPRTMRQWWRLYRPVTVTR